MDLMTRNELTALASLTAGPFVSIYLPLAETWPASEDNRVRFRNCLDLAQGQLLQTGLTRREVQTLLKPGWDLQETASQWPVGDGHTLVVLLAPGFFRRYRLSIQAPEAVHVAAEPWLLPLARSLMTEPRYLLLALSPKEVRLYRCTTEEMLQFPLPASLPKPTDELFADNEIATSLQYHSASRFGEGGYRGTAQGHGNPRDDWKTLLDDFFHVIARELDARLMREGLPLILAGVDYYHPMFRRACHYPRLLSEGVLGSADELSEQELLEQSRPLAEAWYHRAVEAHTVRFNRLVGQGQASDRLERIVPAAWEGRVREISAAIDNCRWGVFHPATGQVEIHEQRQPGDCDLRDYAVRQTLLHGGDVYITSPQDVPGCEKLAAVFRW